MAKKISGCFPALVTPMKEDGNRLNHEADYEAFKQLVEHVVKGGVTGIVPVGCTGHVITLTEQERIKIVETALDAAGKAAVIPGDGNACTRDAIAMAKKMENIGVKQHLQISPYQNKPTQQGLFEHYSAIADAIEGEIIVYNVPGRTGRNIEPETVAKLAKEHSNIISVKEASGDLEQIKKAVELTQDYEFDVLSGDDGLTLDIIKAGGTGCISVAANVAPKKTSSYIRLALEGKFEEAAKIDAELKPLFETLFIETNPSPCHYALRKIGIPVGTPRLPLVDLSKESAAKMDAVLQQLGLI